MRSLWLSRFVKTGCCWQVSHITLRRCMLTWTTVQEVVSLRADRADNICSEKPEFMSLCSCSAQAEETLLHCFSQRWKLTFPWFSTGLIEQDPWAYSKMLTLHVKHGKSSHPVTVKQDTRMSEVMQIVEQLTEVPTRQQKLICQGKVLDSNSTIESLNLRQGSKLMLMTAGGQTQVRQITVLQHRSHCINQHQECS